MNPIAHFVRRYRLSASHRLHVPSLSDAQNRDTFGKCNNPHGHGHNYTIEIAVAGPINRETGMVIDLVQMDALVRHEIIDRWDHTNLNIDPVFSADFVPSTENFAIEVENILRTGIADLATRQNGTFRLARVRIEETSNNAFDLLSGDTQFAQPSF